MKKMKVVPYYWAALDAVLLSVDSVSQRFMIGSTSGPVLDLTGAVKIRMITSFMKCL